MLLLRANLANAARELDADPNRFLLWVAVHEQTHSVQFAAVPWLRDHVAGVVARLIETASGNVDVAALTALAKRVLSSDPRRALRKAMRGELTRALAGPDQAAVIDELQATMAVIEGYAEHVMDAAAQDDPGLAGMRARMDERRARRRRRRGHHRQGAGHGHEAPPVRARQVLERCGRRRGRHRGPEPGLGGARPRLPSLAELEAPRDWLERVVAAPVA